MFELWRKRRELDRINKLYDTEIKKAKKEKKSSNEIDNLRYGLIADTNFVEQAIKALVSDTLVRKGERMLLPVPSLGENEMWERGDMTGRWYLTPIGITKLRSVIREEEAARRKAILEWTGPLIGIIGATTGLLAVIFTVT